MSLPGPASKGPRTTFFSIEMIADWHWAVREPSKPRDPIRKSSRAFTPLGELQYYGNTRYKSPRGWAPRSQGAGADHRPQPQRQLRPVVRRDQLAGEGGWLRPF